jgi:hypothetical protein
MIRDDVVAAMGTKIPDFFKDETKNGRQILDKAEKLATDREEQYIKSVCSEYELPLFDVPTDANTFE